MSFFKGLANKFSGAAGTASAAPTAASASCLGSSLPPAARMRYTLCRNRWHLDARDPVSVILLHDVLRSSHSVSPLTAAITRMPATGHCPIVPLDVYAPDLRFHGRTATTAATQPEEVPGSSNMLLAHTSDVIRFASSSVVEFQQSIHLIGVGHGARVALAAAIACPGAFKSVTAIDGAADAAATESLLAALRQLPGDVSKETLASLSRAAETAIPHTQDRADVLADFNEPSSASGNAGVWQRAPLDGPAFADVAGIHAWPSAAFDAAKPPKFDGQVLSIGKRFPAAKGVPAEAMAFLNESRIVSQQLPADATADKVLDTILRTHNMHGEVEQVVNVACGDGY